MNGEERLYTYQPERDAGGIDDKPGGQVKVLEGEGPRALCRGQALRHLPQAGGGCHVHLPVHTFPRGAW